MKLFILILFTALVAYLIAEVVVPLVLNHIPNVDPTWPRVP